MISYRLSVLSDGRVRYELRHPWPTAHGATTELTFEPLQFMRRLAAIISAPYTNMVRHFGCFANRSKFRARLPQTPEAQAKQVKDHPIHRSGRRQWRIQRARARARARAGRTISPNTDPKNQPHTMGDVTETRSFGIDALRCECGAQMVPRLREGRLWR